MRRIACSAAAAALLFAACAHHAPRPGHIRANVRTDFNLEVDHPRVPKTTYVYEDAVVIGSVELGEHVLVAPHAFVRGDEGQHIHVGNDSNIQDCAGIHALESVEQDKSGKWHTLAGRLFTKDGTRISYELKGEAARLTSREAYSVWVGERCSIAHQALVHGPAWIGNDTFIGMQAQVFNAKVGEGCVVAPRALVMGVDVAPGRLVPAGAVITTQAEADALKPVAGTPFETLNRAVIHVNVELAEKYLEQERGE